jgi:Plasmid pRiA4b ORF-3-like protein
MCGAAIPAAHTHASLPGNATVNPRNAAASPGFCEMLEARADPTHPDHAEISEWLDEYDPDALDAFPIRIALETARFRLPLGPRG